MQKRYIEISKLPNFEVTVEGGQKFVLLPFEHLYDIPSVDVIEVVRCKDCKHYKDCKELYEDGNITFDDNGYCHYGELKV